MKQTTHIFPEGESPTLNKIKSMQLGFSGFLKQVSCFILFRLQDSQYEFIGISRTSGSKCFCYYL